MTQAKFTGFSKKTISFLKGLQKNNNKIWFQNHRKDYDEELMDPAKIFVVEMGQKLLSISPGIESEPRVNRSIFRINRDIRFSKDKRPYKTWLALRFWEGAGPKVSPCFYFHLSGKELVLGYGLYMMDKPYLEEYRKSLDNPRFAKELVAIQKKLKQKGIELEGETYKQVPRGFAKDHPQAELLKHSGLYAGSSYKLPKELYKPGLVGFCMKEYKKYAALHAWTVKMVKRAK
ncbi:DUF2461 domain-containing protein [Patescibacteria group bacterium]|nr:DUF2461 domain-containing protein [Patescibacteria group bacterium]